MKKIVTVLSFFLLFQTQLRSETEPNDDASQADTLLYYGMQTGSLSGADANDWYLLQLPQGGVLTLSILKTGGGNGIVYLRDASQAGFPEISNYYISFWDSPPEGWALSSALLAGNYFVQVQLYSNDFNYTLTAALAPPAFAEDQEPNDSYTQAGAATAGSILSGCLRYYMPGSGPDQQDWYQLDLPHGGQLSVNTHKKGPGNVWIYLRDGEKTGQPELTNYYTGYWESPPEGWTWTYPVLAGTYFIQLANGENILDYQLNPALAPTFFGEDAEPNDTLTTALDFQLNDTIAGLLGYYRPGSGIDNWDWYQLIVPEFGQLAFRISKSGYENCNVRLRNDSVEIASNYFSFGDQETLFSKLVPAGKYYLGFEKLGGDVQYRVISSLLPAPQGGFSFTRSDNAFSFENTTLHPASFLWKFDDGATASTVNAFHEYNEPGNFNVCLIASNVAGADTFCQQVALPGVARAVPNQGGNTGDVTLEVFGGGLDTFYTAKIMQGSTVIAGSNFTGFAGRSSIFTRFDLRNAPVGIFDLRIEKSGGPSYLAPGGFKIVQGVAADPWVRIDGRNRILYNTWSSYTLNYGNYGNVDATMAPVWLVISRDPGLDVTFQNTFLYTPDTLAGEPAGEGLYLDIDSVFGHPFAARVYPLMFPLIQAGAARSIQMKIKTGGNLQIRAWTEKPWFQSPINEIKMECIGDALAEAPSDLNMTQDKVQCSQVSAAVIMNSLLESYDNKTRHEPQTKPFEYYSTFIKVIRAATKICGVSSADDRKKISAWTVNVMLNHYLGSINMPTVLNATLENRSAEQCPAEFEPQNPASKPLTAASSLDPNEKSGPAGYGPENYIGPAMTFPYSIFFENKPDATAPAHTVVVTDTLDKTKFDLNSFAFGHITIGDSVVYPSSGARQLVYDYKDFIPNLLTLRIVAVLDTATGIARWEFRSLDPLTLEDIEDPDLGFLPPNLISPEGQGSVAYTVRLKNTPQHLEQVKNRAGIVFDANQPILTNLHKVTFDLLPPVSAIQPLPGITDTSGFLVQWSGTDNGSGLQAYNIYYRLNGGPDLLWLGGTTATSAVFTAEGGNLYAFYSIAVDNAGNSEPVPTVADAATTVITAVHETGRPNESPQVFPNPAIERIVLQFSRPRTGIFVFSRPDGALVFRENLHSIQELTFSVAGLPRGVYFWKWTSEAGLGTFSGKVLVL